MTNGDKHDERREHQRMSVPTFPVKVEDADSMRDRYLRDLSQGGVFIETSQVLPVDRELIVELHVPDHEVPLTLNGCVVRIEIDQSTGESLPCGMGIRFVNLAEDSEVELAALLADHGEAEADDDIDDDTSEERCLEIIAGLERKLESTDDRIAQLHDDLAHFREEDASSRQLTTRLEKRAEALQAQAASSDAAVLREVLEENARLRAELDERSTLLQTEREQAERSYTEALQAADEFEQRRQAARAAQRDSEEAARERITVLERELQEQRCIADTQPADLGLEAARARVGELERDLVTAKSAAEEQLAALREKRAELSDDVAKLRAELATVREARAGVSDQVERAQATSKRLRARRQDMERFLSMIGDPGDEGAGVDLGDADLDAVGATLTEHGTPAPGPAQPPPPPADAVEDVDASASELESDVGAPSDGVATAPDLHRHPTGPSLRGSSSSPLRQGPGTESPESDVGAPSDGVATAPDLHRHPTESPESNVGAPSDEVATAPDLHRHPTGPSLHGSSSPLRQGPGTESPESESESPEPESPDAELTARSTFQTIPPDAEAEAAPPVARARPRRTRLLVLILALVVALALAVQVLDPLDVHNEPVAIAPPSQRGEIVETDSESDPRPVDEPTDTDPTAVADESPVPEPTDPADEPADPADYADLEPEILSSSDAAQDADKAILAEAMKLGAKALRRGKFRSAADSFLLVLKHEPNNEAALMACGKAYLELGATRKSIQFFKRANTLNPRNRRAYQLLGNAYTETGEIEKAREAYEAFLARESTGQRAEEVRYFLQQLGK